MPEYVKFAAAMGLFTFILIGSYWSVVFPIGRRREDQRRAESEPGTEGGS